MHSFSKFRSPSFLDCFWERSAKRSLQRTKKHRKIELRFFGTPFGPFWGWGGSNISVRDLCHKIAGFYHVLSVSVCCWVLWRKSNDVLMKCFCAVSLSGTKWNLRITVQKSRLPLRCRLWQAQRDRVLLGAEASGRHALHGETLPCGSHHVVRRLENICDLRKWSFFRQVGHVRQCAMCQEHAVFVITLTPEGICSKGDRNLLFFTLISILSIFIPQCFGKWNLDASNAGKKEEGRDFRGPGRAGHPVFTVADGTVNFFFFERTASENIHLDPGSSGTRRKNKKFFQGIPDELPSPTPHTTSRRLNHDDKKAISDFWTIRGEFIFSSSRWTQSQLYIPKEESFPLTVQYIDQTRTTRTSLDVLLEKNIEDYWDVDVKRELSDA